MKPIVLIVITFICLSCKAQSPILPYNSISIPEGAYCKDLNNDLDKFTGTWKYINGNTEFIVVIVKNEQVFRDLFSKYYIDELAGNYRYVKNGVEVVNTLLNNTNEQASFSGSEISNDTNRFLLPYFKDPGKPRASYKVNLKYLGFDVATNSIRMEWKLMQTDFYSGYVPGETPPTPQELDQTIRVPKSVILVKQ